MKISEFAKRAGVTVKTLLHYDKLGLLIPSQRSDRGYRIYSDKDFLRLQQITTLKFIGLSLNEIKELLDEKEADAENIISIQKRALEEKKRHIESVMDVLNKAENQIKGNGFLEVEQLIEIIKVTNMESKVKEQYKTAENFNLRGNLHSYNINKIDWTNWCFNEMDFPNKARVLEIGCGTGELWYKNRHSIDEGWDITLSDFSEGMLQKTKEKLQEINHNFKYEVIDVVIARHMIYLVPDIEKALSEIKRVLVKGGSFYVTTNGREAMGELNEIMEKFDSRIGLSNNGMCERFHIENGEVLLKKYFDQVKRDVLSGKIVVDRAEPVVSYKASTIKGRDILVGERKQEFIKYIEEYIKENGNISITTKACIFKVKK